MKLVVLRENLKEAVAAATRAQGGEGSLPILKNFLLQAASGHIKVIATNLELAIEYDVPGKVLEPGQVAVPSNALYDLLSSLKSERLNIELKERILTVKTDNYDAKIQCAPTDEFPVIPKVSSRDEKLTMKSVLLREAVSQVMIAAQASDVRPELSSILLLLTDEGLKLVATDSFRLAEKTLPANLFESSFEGRVELLLPLKTAQELVRLMKDNEEVTLHRDEYQMLFVGPRWELVSRLNEGNFPNYEAILPKEFKTEATVSRADLLEALKVTSVFGSQLNEITVRILDSGKAIEIFSHNQTLGENNYRLPAHLTKTSLSEMAFNWRYLQDGLKVIGSEEVYWALSDENRPALIKAPEDQSFFYILMPILR